MVHKFELLYLADDTEGADKTELENCKSRNERDILTKPCKMTLKTLISYSPTMKILSGITLSGGSKRATKN